MKISLVQFCPVFGDKSVNVQKIKAFAEESESEIIIFPELCTTGYFFQNRTEALAAAEPFGGKTISLLQDISTRKGKAMVVGFAERMEDRVYNSAALLLPDAALSTVYRKTHLFYKERFCFDEGDTGFFVVKWQEQDLNIGLMICYDWRFPEAARCLALKGADLIVCPSNLVTDVWHLATPARAIENKVYFAVANRTGRENRDGEELYFNGKSAVYSYSGKPLAIAGETEEKVLTVDIFPEMTRNKSFNAYNDIFGDRRPKFYEI